MKPNYIAKKSCWTAFNFKLVLLSLLIIPIVILIVMFKNPLLYALLAFPAVAIIAILIRIIIRKCEYYEFYDNKVVYKKGVFNRRETVSTFLGVLSVEVEQRFIARIFNFGNVVVDTVGRWDMDIIGVAKPHRLKRYLETKAASKLTAAFAAGPENFGHFDTSPMV